ncbi:M20/M25/M40 family metallo-hydrolase [Anaerovorax sp. IOR16]|uniref:M20/M25/M40 family metallo-hydrolase n=1 Tax=Anaerovorax sp. IOR16 TaxID=2773458 RepID=UPI0019D215E7|nr:M20/M25/M40 family metallo-hydrolase [Anaerovorax sp. IOR16]
MFKKRLSLIIVIAMVLASFAPAAYATDTMIYGTQYTANEFLDYQNPIGALDADEDLDWTSSKSSLSSKGITLPEVDNTTGSAMYCHLKKLSVDIGTRIAATDEERQARDYIEAEFKALGYSTTGQAFTYTRKGSSYESSNVIAVKPGKTDKQIIVGAHYDSVNTKGASDNASGVAVMLGAAETIKNIETQYTIKFIAFGAEEVGTKGSQYYASEMSETEKSNTIAMINLDTVLVGDKMYVYGNLGEKGWFRDQTLELADTLDLNVITQQGLNPDYPAGTTGDWSDHDPFDQLGFPWIYFESTNWDLKDSEGNYSTGESETEQFGEIMHTERDELEFMHENLPGRVENRLYTYTTLLSHLLVKVNPPIAITASTNLLSMSEVKEVNVEFDLGYAPQLTDLKWTLGEKSFEEWKSFDTKSGTFSGNPFIHFSTEPYIEDEKVKAVIKCELPFGKTNLQGRPYPRRVYPELLGNYELKVIDQTKDIEATTIFKLNAYDSYHTQDEILPAIEEIIGTAKEDRYIEYAPMGKSAQGRDIPFVMFARDKDSIDIYLNQTLPMMLEEPAAFIEKIETGTAGVYKPAIWFNNIHSDEANGVDAQIDMLKNLATLDEITFQREKMDSKDIEMVTLDVQKLLDNYIILFNLNNNPDGRFTNSRETAAGFDPNRDVTYQTQVETANVFQGLAKWSPMIFNDFHGFVPNFLIEPCTPPHEPNFEYDLLMSGAIEHAHALGKSGIANTDYDHYIIPMFDYGDGWDDGAPMYAAVLSLMHGAVGHTVEIPELNQESNDAFMYAGFGSLKYALENKEKLFKNQLEIYKRGVEGIDDRKVDPWLINANGDAIGRPRGENENFFPEYYVLPVNSELQKNSLAAYEMAEFLIKNGVKVQKTNTPVTVGDTTYPSGSFIVDMHQAKRGFANCVLYDGSDFSDFAAMYAEVTMCFPDLRGFNKYEVRVADAFQEKAEPVTSVLIPTTEIPWKVNKLVIKATNNDAIEAVNELLENGKLVYMTYSSGSNYKKGDFVVAKKDLETVKDNYFLELAPFSGKATIKRLKNPKVVAIGDELIYVLEGLGFDLEESYHEADVIVDEDGVVDEAVKDSIENGISYIGVGGYALCEMEESGLLPGFDCGMLTYEYKGQEYSECYEGVLRSDLNTDYVITGRYNENDILYNNSASWIESVPKTSKVLATISDKDDFYIAGWWPNHEVLKGKPYIIQDKVDDASITLFANHVTNKAHPSHQFRMLANAIYDSTPGKITKLSSGGGSSNSGNQGNPVTPPVNEDVKDTEKTTKTTPSDIKNHWSESSIQELINMGAVATYPDKTFKPNKNITRAELATILVKAFKIDLKTDRVFSDTKNHWAKDYIAAAAEFGIVAGYNDNQFGPDDLLTREQMAVMIVKAMKLNPELAQATFGDQDKISDWAKDYIAAAGKANLISGYPDGSFKPKANATRGEAASIIVSALKSMSN